MGHKHNRQIRRLLALEDTGRQHGQKNEGIYGGFGQSSLKGYLNADSLAFSSATTSEFTGVAMPTL
jgi:hypothetical protein